MILYICNHDFKYEVESLCRAFFINEKFEIKYNNDKACDFYIFTALDKINDKLKISIEIKKDSLILKEEKIIEDTDEKTTEYELCFLLYKMLCKFTGKTLKWGMLTGIRPVKLFRELSKTQTVEKAEDLFKNKFLVSQEKTTLAKTISKNQENIINKSSANSFSLYVSIPFCPSRCNYCSFVSQSIEKCKHLIPEYLDLLCREIKTTAKLAKKLNLNLKSIYIGGGTPTILEAEQIKILTSEILNNFASSELMEFTFEAGRPDTISKDKLLAIKNSQVNRISINPQTLNDDILIAIGRKHTVLQTYKAFELARDLGFNNINMDLIAGLEKDTLENFSKTIKNTLKLSPESITLHTLALKKSSNLNLAGKQVKENFNTLVENMLNLAYSKFSDFSYEPYYLYRQSKMLGNLENTGFSKPGFKSAYNIFMMEEIHTVLAVGAGAVTKLKNPYNNKIERIFNFKYPYEYISRFDELIARKEKVSEFYDEF